MAKTKKIIETKCTCKGCGNVWFYDKRDEAQIKADKWEAAGNSMSNAGKSMMCCGGCLPAIFIPEKDKVKVKDLNVCEKCGSKAVTKETIEHNVE
ncbi:hypothetical protein [Alkalicoccobacillus plakortidis]|uniref:Uncharacterized protein n=1 Tax=Alkalicoccobacillus plakortidis TaxID=444060 RepID=A0ABT0XI16_9BACI|nr:hypothetical protein [Alkalicoccobacillus plakortidis]MCM2675556.1 hypothetical protein [Alkalicoccobacillus plakortidis]